MLEEVSELYQRHYRKPLEYIPPPEEDSAHQLRATHRTRSAMQRTSWSKAKESPPPTPKSGVESSRIRANSTASRRVPSLPQDSDVVDVERGLSEVLARESKRVVERVRFKRLMLVLLMAGCVGVLCGVVLSSSRPHAYAPRKTALRRGNWHRDAAESGGHMIGSGGDHETDMRYTYDKEWTGPDLSGMTANRTGS